MEEVNNGLVEKTVKVYTNPATGESVIGEEIDYNFNKSFDDMVNKINDGDDIFSSVKPISETDAIEYMANEDNDLLSSLTPNTGLSKEDIRVILQIANKKIKRENVNTYAEFPESVKQMIGKYVRGMGTIGTIAQVNQMKKIVADSIIDEFITNIQLNKAKYDFATELQHIYENANKDLSDTSIEIIEERNKAYREAADKIEDESKRNKLKAILDRIDEARALTELKELAKTSKIKSIELEKPEKRLYFDFINKYINSSNNIYDIALAKKILQRHLYNDGYTEKDADIFLILFCKQVRSYSVDNPLEHAYMYYVLYYCAMLDGDKSTFFKKNVEEVIDNYKSSQCNTPI